MSDPIHPARIAVVGAGIGGLSAAVALAAEGREVHVYEAGPRPGGKAGIAVIDGVEVDTGPSVLTLPRVFDDLLRAAGTSLADRVTLRRLDPGFRYRWPDGAVVDVFHDPRDTIDSVRAALGASAARELEGFLGYAGRIWEAAAPHFVFDEAPTLGSLLWRGPALLGSLAAIDPLRTMQAGIEARVREPHLRDLLTRYATYNGSDPRTAPATLNCIAHVEMSLGGWGVEGGMFALVEALVDVARERGVQFHYDAPVERLLIAHGRVAGVRVAGRDLPADAVVCNAEIAHLLADLLPPRGPEPGFSAPAPPSLSGWTGILKARRTGQRVAHEVLFPADYAQEFADLFEHDRPPVDPTVYLCAQEVAHGRAGWPDHEPVFLMANAPAEPPGGRSPEVWERLRAAVVRRLRAAGLAEADDALAWQRTPRGLAARFPGSRGSIYGAASNGRLAAFQRPPNRTALPGLYLASGSAHPGGGLPLCAQSGRAAARALAADLPARRRAS